MAAAVVNCQRRVAVSPARLARTAERALAALGRAAGDVDVVVVDDAEIRRLNNRHRGVGRRTDVLAFPLATPDLPSPLVGQIVISGETARRQANRLKVPLAIELDLLVTHGVLHLVGYDDRDPVEADLMHEREREILSAGRRRLPPRLWRGLLKNATSRVWLGATFGHADAQRMKRAMRSRVASVSGHPRLKPDSRTPRQRSRVAAVSGHPRSAPGSGAPLQ